MMWEAAAESDWVTDFSGSFSSSSFKIKTNSAYFTYSRVSFLFFLFFFLGGGGDVGEVGKCECCPGL